MILTEKTGQYLFGFPLAEGDMPRGIEVARAVCPKLDADGKHGQQADA